MHRPKIAPTFVVTLVFDARFAAIISLDVSDGVVQGVHLQRRKIKIELVDAAVKGRSLSNLPKANAVHDRANAVPTLTATLADYAERSPIT